MTQYYTSILTRFMDNNNHTIVLNPSQMTELSNALENVTNQWLQDWNSDLKHQLESIHVLFNNQTKIKLMITTTNVLSTEDAKTLLACLEEAVIGDTNSLHSFTTTLTGVKVYGWNGDILQLQVGQKDVHFTNLDEYHGLYKTNPDDVIQRMTNNEPDQLDWFNRQLIN